MALVQFCADDGDLDDAELWAVIDSAAASRPIQKSPLRTPLGFAQHQKVNSKFSSPVVTELPPSPDLAPVSVEVSPGQKRGQKCQKIYSDSVHHIRAYPQLEYRVDEDGGVSSTGELVQRSSMHQPQKLLRRDVQRTENNDVRRLQNNNNYASAPKPLQQIPSASSSSKRYAIQEFSCRPANTAELVERPNTGWHDAKENDGIVANTWMNGMPSASMFKQFQNAAMSVLEKGDYVLMQGKHFIKKSGWRKIAFFFNISFEIKDKTIQLDQNSNVLRAEFVVRASMHGGRFSDGWGSCDRAEKRFNKPNHDIPSTAETRAKTRACQCLTRFYLCFQQVHCGMDSMGCFYESR